MKPGWVLLWLFGASSALLGIGLGVYTRHLRPSIFRAQLTFSEAAFRRTVAQWQPEWQAVFATHFKADYLFLVSYAGFGYFGGQHLLADASPLPMPLAILLLWALPLAAAFDAVENLFHQRFISSEPGSVPSTWFAISGVAAAVKWLLIVVFVVLAVVAWRA
jgi:hypothetical protein